MPRYEYTEQMGSYRHSYGFDTMGEMEVFLEKHKMGPYCPRADLEPMEEAQPVTVTVNHVEEL